MNAALLLVLLVAGSKVGPGHLTADRGSVDATGTKRPRPGATTAAGATKERTEAKRRDHDGKGTRVRVKAVGKTKAKGRAVTGRAHQVNGAVERKGVPLRARLTGRLAVEQEAGGSHMRIETNHGPVHLFRPPGFDRKTAGVVVYVHGYYTHVDEAWYQHRLAEQFAASRRNALFIAPEAPAAPEEKPFWSTLRRLLNVVFRTARIKEPSGPLVVVGHSGAYRTLVPWLDEPALHHLILIDALYGNEPDFLDWLGRERGNHMTLVVKGTAKWADPFVKSLPYAITLPRIPGAITDLSHSARVAKLLCLRSQYGHFELITEGRVMPVLLGRCGLKTCRHAVQKDDSAAATLRHGRRRAGSKR